MKRKKRKYSTKSKQSLRDTSSNTQSNNSNFQNGDSNTSNNGNDSSQSNGSNNDNNGNQNSSCNSNSSNQQQSKLCYFSSLDYIVLASTLAIALGEELSDNDLSILSTFLAVLSDQLALIESVNDCSSGDDNSVFVPPIPAGNGDRSNAGSRTNPTLRKSHSKKIVKRKVKKK